jgi:hypothetical protein
VSVIPLHVPDEPDQYLLTGREGTEGPPRFWSFEHGWVARTRADVFDSNDLVTCDLPAGRVVPVGELCHVCGDRAHPLVACG